MQRERRVFVYGTLMPGHLRWPVIESHVVGHRATSVPGLLFDTGAGYPAALFTGPPPEERPSGGGGSGAGPSVQGVLAEIDGDSLGATLRLLDSVEGGDYRRRQVTTSTGEPCWAYEWRAGLHRLRLLPEGRWAGDER